MNPIKYLKNLAIAYNQDKNEMQKFYNNCLLLFIWMVIAAGIAAIIITNL